MDSEHRQDADATWHWLPANDPNKSERWSQSQSAWALLLRRAWPEAKTPAPSCHLYLQLLILGKSGFDVLSALFTVLEDNDGTVFRVPHNQFFQKAIKKPGREKKSAGEVPRRSGRPGPGALPYLAVVSCLTAVVRYTGSGCLLRHLVISRFSRTWKPKRSMTRAPRRDSKVTIWPKTAFSPFDRR